MKTAVSVPDDIYEAAEDLSEELGVSRSGLYSQAVAEFVNRHRQSDVTERLNAVYAEEDSRLDPVLDEIQVRSLDISGESSW